MTIPEEKYSSNLENTEDVYVFPASYAQKRMWFLDQFEPGSPYYNIPVAFKIRGKFDKDLFIKTVSKIIDRHESLRTTFTEIKGQPFQVISPESKIDIPIIDLSTINTEKVEERLKKIATQEARAPFNLSKGPLFRVKIIKLAENENAVLITMHHIISDGWSMGIMVEEITSIYSSLLSGEEISLPELEIQYADFSEWQNKYLTGEILEEQLNYWKNKLGDSNSFLDLPLDRNRKAVYTNNGSSIERLISADILFKLQKIANSENASLFMILVAAFNVLLSRYSGQQDINIGTPIANRTNKDIERIIGLFINTLVIRTELGGNPTFKELLRRVRQSNLEAFEHQDLPFEMLVDAIQPERNMSYAPLFQVMLILQNNPVKTANLPDFEVSMLDVDMGTATSDITYSISTGKSGASCAIEFNTDLFDEMTMQRMFDDFEALLNEIVNNPEEKIYNYRLVNKNSLHKIINVWNTRELELPKNNGIHSLFEKWAVKTPDNIAVVDDHAEITYRELNEKANRLANYLKSRAQNRNIPIGISQNKTVNLLASVLGVLKSGHCYLPLDPTYPQDRLSYMIQDSEIELLITDRQNQDIFTDFTNKIIVDDFDEFQVFSEHNLDLEISDNDLAYIIYTSGSTGKAKGTMVQHNSLINIYKGWETDYGLLTEVKSHLQMASFSFDVFGGDWVRALCSGGKLVLVNREKLLDAEELYKLILKEDIDIAEFVPAVLRNLIDYIEENSYDLKMFKVLIAGSDIWYVKEYKNFSKYISENTRLINSFGLTETAIDSTFYESRNISLPDERLVPIGKPFPNIQLYILDKYYNILPIGVKGELFIGGISLARGYYKRPHLTAEKFIPNNFSKVPGERLYCTGDLARYLPDGNIEFLGRSDNQIKLRGFRIELGEIENALSEHDKIRDAIVLLKEDQSGEQRLVSYLISNEAIDLADLRGFLSDRLPDYMVPSAYLFMEKFPLTPNGKIDRKALPEPDQEDLNKALEIDYIPPRNDIEEKICKIWSEILLIDKIGVTHNFFLLGGHSLLATQVVSRIKSETKVDLPLRVIFEKPTVEEIALEIDTLKISSGISDEVKIEKRKSDENIPLSFAQERLWFLDQLEPNSPFYNIPESYRIRGEIDFSILERCFNIIISRHEILRTYFSSNDGTPIQIIESDYKIKIPIIDLSIAVDVDDSLQKLVEEEAHTPISIDESPLFRIKIIKLKKDEFVFLMTIHHIISDDWSTNVIVKELGVLYESILNSYPAPLEDLVIQYADYAVWQRDWLQGDLLKSHFEYWRNQLAGIPSLLELPWDKSRPKEQTFNGDYISFNLSENIIQKLNIVSKQEGATVFMILLAVFKVLLYKLSGQSDIVVGTPSANRNRKDIEPLIGFFVNTLALRTDCSGNPSFSKLLSNIKETTIGAFSHQDLPFEYIVDAIKPERNLSHTPIFQVMFVYQTVGRTDQGSSGEISISTVESHSRTSKFDLTLFMLDSADETGGAFEYNTDLFEKRTIEKFIVFYKNLLETVLDNVAKPLEEISLLNFDEQKNIVEKLNSTEIIPEIEGFVHSEFSRIAESQKEKIAVSSENREMSFGELEIKSNQLANYLTKLGVGSEDLAAVCIPRSFELISSLFGVLKAGAAYLPVDPNYPEERINYLLSDSDAKIVITNSEFADLFKDSDIKILQIDLIKSHLDSEDKKPPKVNFCDDNVCYVIYTSGSTGQPKGTVLTHKGFVNYLNWAKYAYPYNLDNGSLVHSTISFDATITSIFPPLLSGRKIVLMKESDELDELANTVRTNNKFSTIKITPAHLELLSNLLPNNEADNVSEAMIIGGENLTSKQTDFWRRFAPKTLLFNEYGPTEAVVGCVVYEASRYKGKGSIPIGKVIPKMQIYVLDKNLAQVPVGVPGELFIGGISIARGYLNKPGLTAQKFVPNPFAKKNGDRIYKSGDLVKIQHDGNLVFLGRIDDQVKVRGYRIELGELEVKLNSLPNIKDSVVDVKDFGDGDKRIIAYLVAENEDIDLKQIKESLKYELPDYMLPAYFLTIEKIPLTINGKINRKELPMPAEEIRQNTVEFVPAVTETEKLITSFWREILKIEKIGVYDNFFDLGGHSLLVTKLVVRIEDAFNISLPIKEIFAFPTVAELSKIIDEGQYSNADNQKMPPLVRVQNKSIIPLSFTQRRLWFLDQLDEDHSVYNMPMAVRVKSNLNLDALRKTIDYMAERHESLRTNFIEENGIPQQYINETHKILLNIDDFIGISQVDLNERINAVKRDEAAKPFNLASDALVRFRIIKISDVEFILFFAMHHIISDGWSINILMREFIHSYSTFINNKKPDLPELEIQYSDYAIWQQNYLTGEILDKKIEYWISKLKGSPPLLNLPTDKKRPHNKTFNGAHISFNLPQDLLPKINEMIRELQVTPFMFLIGVFKILLFRLSGQRDINVGIPIANRNNVETEGIIGFFANTLVFRTVINGNETLRDYFDIIKSSALDAFSNQDVPFERLVEILKPERDLGHTPLFQVMFVLQDNEIQSLQSPADNSLETLEAESNSTQYDLTLSMNANIDEWEGTFEYNTDLFTRETIEGFIESFIYLLGQILKNEKQRLFEVEFLNEDKKQQILNLSRGSDSQYKWHTVIDKFEEIVAEYPENIACSYDGEKITYRELDINSTIICNHLIEKGMQIEAKIAVMIPSSIELIEVMIGIMKAGCCYLPVDTAYPADRINYIINDSEAKTIIVLNKQASEELNGSDLNIITVNEIKNNSPASRLTRRNICSGNLAYVIYTSGSTGRPKGVMLSHRGLVNLVENQTEDFRIHDKSDVLQFASISFDASISEIFMTLAKGATLHLADRKDLSDPNTLKELLIEKNISAITLPPSLLRVLDEENLDELTTIISAGEKLTSDLLIKWKNNRLLFNAYGPTESTVGVSSFTAEEIDENWETVPIGRPISNVGLYILDSDLNLVRHGTYGELYISGISLARGYLNKPDLTAERFIPNPFSNHNGERLYRTGDLVKYNLNGDIEYIGRVDDQVKVRGYRIELTEIETVLNNLPGIEHSAVIAKGEGESKRLLAFIKPAADVIYDSSAIKDNLKKSLPEYMIPGIFIEIDEIPITSNGKIDRKSLSNYEITESGLGNEYSPPSTEIEKKLVEMWQNLLGIQKIGIHDNFFELGGHSLIVTQLLSRIKEQYKIEINIKSIFEGGSIFSLALLIENLLLNEKTNEHHVIQRIDRNNKIPLSFSQQRLWFIDKLEPGNPFYNLPLVLLIKGQIDTDILAESLDKLIKRHEILRTVFNATDGKAEQIILPSINIPLDVINVENISRDHNEEHISQFIKKEITKPFNLEYGPLFRIKLIKKSSTEFIFILTMHHIISDGWSLNIFLNELIKYYGSIKQKMMPDLMNLSIQYADYSFWQRNWFTEVVLSKHIEYWKSKLNGIPKLLNLPLDRPRPPLQTYNGETITFEISNKLKDALNILGKENNATMFMTLLAGLNILLHRYTGQEDIVIGTPIANRKNSDLEKLIGFFINTLAIRSKIKETFRFIDLLKEVRTTALEAYEFQDLPFEMLLDKLEVQRDLSHTPIFQVMFVLQNIPTGEISLPNLEISPYDTEASIAKFDMQFTLAEHSDGISGSVEYNTDLFNAETILQLIKSYQLILENISENPQWPIAGIPIITAEDKDKLLSLCNSKIINEKTEIPVFKIFEEQAVKSPNAIALTFENIVVSYYQLNVRANRLARFIQKLGVKNDELVGLCLDRSIDMVIGIIAIFKAGGAYVPLDPTYPKERLDYIINDSNPKVIITSTEYLSNFGSANKNIVSIDEDWKEIEQENNSDLYVQISNHNLAYIIYTSGSTGNPKGVMVTHGNLNRLFNSTQTWYKFNDKDVWTFFHSYAFDFSVWELWGALIYGGRIVIVPYIISRSPENFYNLLQREKVTVLNQTPSAFRQLIQEDSKRPKNDRLSLRYVIFGGDKLDLHTLSPWFDKYGEKNPLLINMYGITETTVHVTYRPINLFDLTEMPGSIIGEPIHDLRIYILDKNLEPAPIGVPGEIYVGGSGLARGYKNQPDLTATRFIPDLFSKNPGERLYRTGDQARFLQNGDIEYLNRIDNQVQIHGFRVELGEIENVIGLHPEIVENIVVFNNETDNKKLVAYYVLKTDSEISVEEFRKFLKNKLPDYMLPGAFVKMEKFPLTEHGKIDRKKLPKAEFLRPTLETQYVEPSSEEERILAEIWKRLLNIDQIGINDNFFDLGGDSILSIQMIALANQQGLHLTPRQVFQVPIIKDLAEISIKNQDSIIRDNIISGEAPLTPIQSWFFEKHKTNPNRFNTSMFLELSEEISVEDLKSVTSELIKYHSVLRTEFIFTNDSWRQNIIPEIDDLPVEFINLSNCKKKDLKEQVAAEVENVQGSFDIQNCPLFKVIYFHFGNNINPQLLVVFHHLILDGVSWRILINDFFILLRQLLSNAQLDLGNRTTSYMRWSEELSKLAEYKNIDQESEYWKNLLNYKDIDYPIDFPKGKNTYGSTKDITLSMNTDQTKYLLTQIPEKYGVSINDVLIFVLLEVISKWCNAKRIAIELEGHGREDLFDNVDLSRTLGWFTTIYPVVFEIIEGSYSDKFQNVSATLQKVPNKGLDFGLLKYLSNKKEIKHLINEIPHAQVNFNYLGQFDQTVSEMEFEFRMSNYSAGMEQDPDEIKSNLINVVAVINGGQLHIRWLYSKNLFKTTSIKRLAKNYNKVLKNIIEN